MLRRFTIVFLAAFIVQVTIAFMLLYFFPLGTRGVMWAYYPFVFLVIPVVQALAGGSDGNLGYVLFCAPVVGALAYSVLLGLAAVFIKVFHYVTPKKNM